MKKLICTLAIALTTVSSYAIGPYFTIKELIDKTNSDVGKISMLTYIMAVSDMGRDILMCVPAGTQAQTLYDLTFKYVSQGDVQDKESAALVITRVLMAKYPCKKQVPNL